MKLDKYQSECVYTDKPHVIVIAAAGSGKTRVLTERVKYLLGTGVSPSEIVAITFTNLAAEEMRERLSDVPMIGDAFIGTIHSFANKIMRSSGEIYQLFTEELSLQYHQFLITRYCRNLTTDRYCEYLKLRKEVEQGKKDEDDLYTFFNYEEKMDLISIHRDADKTREIHEEWVKSGMTSPEPPRDSIATLCIKNHVITFDELIERANKYFQSTGSHLDHLLVDEFQDVGRLEAAFFEGLNPDHSFYVGDDYQSIYGFKGGDVTIFKKLVKNPDYTTYYLSNNYRNGKAILDVADKVIRQVPDRIQKKVIGISTEQGHVTFSTRYSIEDTLKSIPSDMYREYFILTRSNKDLYKIANMCETLNIPFITFKREGLKLSELKSLMSSDAVKILTVHTSKGLEADNVILYGNFPLVMPSYYRDAEDERKVMYVGVTRARKNLIILN